LFFAILGLLFAMRRRPQRRGVQEVAIMDGKLAMLYLIIIALLTSCYSDDENIDRMKHAIAALTVARVQAATK
jgi:hypothetical protein